jgi:hypothetical protein
MLVISSSTLALGGEMQFPGKNDQLLTPTASTTDSRTPPPSTEENQIVWLDATTRLVDILLTIF